MIKKLRMNENSSDFDYRLLSRLESDCKYFLGGGYGAEKHLWAKSVEDQIAKMKEIYNSLDVKPEWLTMQDIEHYEKEMKKVKYGKNESARQRHIKEQQANIEVENPGILEVPEDKNVEDLPIKHFVALADKKGLSTITRALNNLQVWNKNKDPKLSKWAGEMIDKVTKRVENQKNEGLIREYSNDLVSWTCPIYDNKDFKTMDNYIKELADDINVSSTVMHTYLDTWSPSGKRIYRSTKLNHPEWFEGVEPIAVIEFWAKGYNNKEAEHIVDKALSFRPVPSATTECKLTIGEIYQRDYIDALIADMETIGYEYRGTDNRGRLVFDSVDGNSTQAFPDWDEVKTYLETGNSELYKFESLIKEEANSNTLDTKLEDIDYIMYKCLDEYNVEVVSDNTFGEYEVSYPDTVKATVKFDLSSDTTAYYVYTINGEGPYETNSDERVCMDIQQYLEDMLYDLDESKCLTEASLPDWQDTIMEEIKNVLNNKHIYADVYEYEDFDGSNDAFVVCVDINDGDWKHEHRRADLIVTDLVNHYDNMEITKLGEEVTSEDGSDTYSAIHKFHIIRYPDEPNVDFGNDKQLDIQFLNKESLRRNRKRRR